MPPPDVRLSVNGKAWGGWTEVRLEHGMTQLAQSFELTLTERWPEQDTPRDIQVGDRCELIINGNVELIGFIDDIGITYGSREHNLVVAGRDKTGDIIDSSAPVGEFRQLDLRQMALILCERFDIDVTANVDVGKRFKKLAVEPGISVFEFIEGVARQRGVILTSTLQGNILITQASDNPSGTRLRLGENILQANALFSDRDRFHSINALGQIAGDDFGFGGLSAHPKGSALDSDIRPQRVLTLLTEASNDELESRAQLEATVRYGESRSVNYTVNGWFDGYDLWRHNRLVDIDDDWLKIHDTWLIANVLRRISNDDGVVTELTVMPPEAFTRLPIPEKDTVGGLFG